MIRMEDASFMPGDDKFSPSMGLLNYQWSDSLLQAELQELELVRMFHPLTRLMKCNSKPFTATHHVFRLA